MRLWHSKKIIAKNRKKPSRQGGFSLLEISIYIAVIGIISVPMLTVIVGITRTNEEGEFINRIQERNRATIHRLITDYRRSMAGTAAVTNAGKTLSFTLLGAFNGVTAEPGNVIRYELRPDPADPNNGADDNGNGVVDENILVRVNETTSEEVIFASHLDPNNSGFALNGDAVVVSISSMVWAKGSQVATEVTETRNIYPRN